MFAKECFAKLYIVIMKGLMSIIMKKVAHVSLIWHTMISYMQTSGRNIACLN